MHQVLLAVACKLANTRVCWFTDNQNVARIMQVESKKPQLHAIALKVFALLVQYQLHLEPEWIPRDLNVRADFLSRIVDYDDWFLDPAIFAHIDAMRGPHTVDRFASFHNAQLPRFNSHCWNPGSEAVDAFTVNWEGARTIGGVSQLGSSPELFVMLRFVQPLGLWWCHVGHQRHSGLSSALATASLLRLLLISGTYHR